ncbi:carbamoyl-phosphate synthase (glutamine-hydrolyzing) large subunit [Bacillaceae bacterium S4-13-56]
MPLRKGLEKVLVIGSGPIVIGQAAEFDYAGTQACLALKEEGLKVVLVNNNPATIMTDQTIADEVYMEPLTVESLDKIIAKERPDGVIGTLGGQTGLNLSVNLYKNNILEKYGVDLLGTSVESIQQGEDREKFRQLMVDIKEPIPESKIIEDYQSGLDFTKEIGFPVIIRPAYTLGGSGGGFAYNEAELERVLKNGLNASPIHQVLVEKSIKGWKEVEYEVMRDENDTCIVVCNMENIDPVGVHTGDSIVVAPSQTLSDVQYQMLRDSSLKVIRSLHIVGGCNIQFALNPKSNEYCIIEVNPRVSRSSALASKATGYPIARMAAKCAVGYHLDEILNPITGNTYASFEPAIDYIVVKLPRFPFDKFSEGNRTLGTQMKATGEVMAIDRSFEGALNKAIRSLEIKLFGLKTKNVSAMDDETLVEHLRTATDVRLFAIAEAFYRGMSVSDVQSHTEIDPWFLESIRGLVQLDLELSGYTWETVPLELLQKAKKKNVSDHRIASIFGIPEKVVRRKWKNLDWKPGYKLVDTCAAEFDAVTPYYYSTWQGEDEVEPSEKPKILVIGSGPIRIGQGVEFDYCSVHAALAVKKLGYEAIVINNNPETVSTDYSIADRLYFEPLAVEDVLQIIEKEKVQGVLIQFGGQTAINLAWELQEEGIPILGTSVEAIDALEDREQFYQFLKKLEIPHITGATASSGEEILKKAQSIGYPVLVRPSYVIGGQSMFIFHDEIELEKYVSRLEKEEQGEKLFPLLVDSYIPGVECEVDVISDGKDVVIPGIMEHVEKAGVHSGDSTMIFPPVTLSEKTKDTLVQYATQIAANAPIIGMMNIQFVVSADVVYVLEVNPRSSRTVPIMSKVTETEMVELAVRVQLGEELHSIGDGETGLLKEPSFYSVKVPVFSSAKLNGVDSILGPEMKSTGEVLGLGNTVEEAMQKAVYFDEKQVGLSIEKGSYLFCSISEPAKAESLSLIKMAVEKGFQIIGTTGTVEFLEENGVKALEVEKDENQLEDWWKSDKLAGVLNIPTQGRSQEKLGFFIRELSVKYQVPCFTSLDTFEMVLGLEKDVDAMVRSLGEYHEKKQYVMR